MDKFNLDNAKNPSVAADAKLKLSLDALNQVVSAAIQARADSITSVFACGSEFFSEQAITVRIV